MGDLRIEHFTPDMTEAAAGMLARAFVTNPLHVATFGPDQQAANDAFFRVGLPLMKGRRLAALQDGTLVGFIHWIESPLCQPSDQEKRRLGPLMLRTVGIRAAWRLRSWLTTWSTHDPRVSHVHLGPVGVLPELQGRGIGSLLMKPYCEQLDGQRQVGYLETDRPEKVRFYRRFGFEVAAEVRVLGLPNFFMTRPSR